MSKLCDFLLIWYLVIGDNNYLELINIYRIIWPRLNLGLYFILIRKKIEKKKKLRRGKSGLVLCLVLVDA